MSIINTEYKDQLLEMHSTGRFVRGHKMLKKIVPFLEKYNPTSILDFGCGHGALVNAIAETYPNMNVYGYDPGSSVYGQIPERDFDAIVSADVLEHIEPENLSTTLKLISNKMQTAGWFRIACYPSKKQLPDGRNAHLIVESPEWWREKILENMQIKIISEYVTVFDKSHKWPGIIGHNYDITVEKI
jgi:cyclopropane fatty-acyl-phospholipid synthase-like methyltransferase